MLQGCVVCFQSCWCLLFCQAVFQMIGVQHTGELLVELHKIPVRPFLQAVEVCLDASMTLWHISHFSQFCVTWKFAEGSLCPIIQILSEDVIRDWTPYKGRPPLAIVFHQGFGPLIMTLWAWKFSFCWVQLTVCSSSPYFDSFSVMVLREKLLKSSLKLK